MKIKNRRWISYPCPVPTRLVTGMAGLLITLLLSSCDDPHPATASAPPLVRALVVPAAVPAKQVNWSGRLFPGQEVSLGFRREGRLAERRVDVGSRVSRGDILARIDATQSREQVMTAQASLLEADAQLQKARQDSARIQKLVQIGTASRARLQESMAALAAAQARRTQAAAQQAEATNAAEFNLLRAPFDGVVTAVSAVPGQILSQGQQIMQFASDKGKHIILNLPQTFSESLHQGDKLHIEFDNGARSRATVLTVSPQSDPQTLLIPVKATLDDQEIAAPFGSLLTGTVIQNSDRVSVIPAAALTRTGDTPAVYVVSPNNNTLQLRPVAVRYYSDDTAAVSSGLSVGEKIVTAGVSRLTSGMKITLQDETQ